MDPNKCSLCIWCSLMGGMAMLYHFYKIKKHDLKEKAFGCFRHENIEPSSPYLRGFSDDFIIPVSRWTELHPEEIDKIKELKTFASECRSWTMLD